MVPLFELVLDAEGGDMEYLSLVDRPAMEAGWLKFSEIKAQFEAVSKEKKILFGPLIIPNKPIYRLSPDGEPFYVVFSSQTIEAMRNRYHRDKKTDLINAQHEEALRVNGYMVESFIKDSTRGMNPPAHFKDLPDGTWFASVKIEDDAIWQRFITSGVFTGFSIEIPTPSLKQVLDLEILDAFEGFLNEINTTLKNEALS